MRTRRTQLGPVLTQETSDSHSPGGIFVADPCGGRASLGTGTTQGQPPLRDWGSWRTSLPGPRGRKEPAATHTSCLAMSSASLLLVKPTGSWSLSTGSCSLPTLATTTHLLCGLLACGSGSGFPKPGGHNKVTPNTDSPCCRQRPGHPSRPGTGASPEDARTPRAQGGGVSGSSSCNAHGLHPQHLN